MERCAEIFDRSRSCLADWRRQEQRLAGIILAVNVLVMLWQAVAAHGIRPDVNLARSGIGGTLTDESGESLAIGDDSEEESGQRLAIGNDNEEEPDRDEPETGGDQPLNIYKRQFGVQESRGAVAHRV